MRNKSTNETKQRIRNNNVFVAISFEPLGANRRNWHSSQNWQSIQSHWQSRMLLNHLRESFAPKTGVARVCLLLFLRQHFIYIKHQLRHFSISRIENAKQIQYAARRQHVGTDWMGFYKMKMPSLRLKNIERKWFVWLFLVVRRSFQSIDYKSFSSFLPLFSHIVLALLIYFQEFVGIHCSILVYFVLSATCSFFSFSQFTIACFRSGTIKYHLHFLLKTFRSSSTASCTIAQKGWKCIRKCMFSPSSTAVSVEPFAACSRKIVASIRPVRTNSLRKAFVCVPHVDCHKHQQSKSFCHSAAALHTHTSQTIVQRAELERHRMWKTKQKW